MSSFNGFTKSDFDTFTIDGLEERMEAIRERIQPKFKEIGEVLTADIASMVGNEMFLHIAKHARRTINPPKDTWLAICHNNRGYKKHPHFQIGLFDDHVFIWLAFIYELPNKKEIAHQLLTNMDGVQKTIPNDYMISMDHMKKEATIRSETDIQEVLERFRDVKKSELLIGKHIPSEDPLLSDGDAFIQFAKNTFETLLPLYRLSLEK